MEQDIDDKRGTFKYTDDAIEYKKARKRFQNRESAVRSRARKTNELERLRKENTILNIERDGHLAEIDELKTNQGQLVAMVNKLRQDLMGNQMLLK